MWGALTAIRLDGPLARRAGSLADRHALTALDAIHLASALALREPGEDVAFVTFDRRLREAAARRGADGPARGRVGARGRHARPYRRRAAPVPARPPVTAASARAPGPRAERLVGATVTAVEAQGKNLLIRFDNGLEVRTHLRMHGSWHRYRPGEPWRRAPARARLVIEVPGSVAVCFDAPVVELFETAGRRRCTRRCGRLGPDLLKDPFDDGEALRRLRDPVAGGPVHRRGAAGPAGARRHRQRGQERGPVAGAGVPVDAGRATWTTPRSRELVAPRPRRPARGRRDRSSSAPCLPARRTALPALRRPSSGWSTRVRTCRASRSGARRCQPDPRSRRMTPTDPIDVTCEPTPGGWTCRVTVGGRRCPDDARGGRLDRGPRPPRPRRCQTPMDLVRRSFVFLLAREPKTSILRRFELLVIARYFPEYERRSAARRQRAGVGDRLQDVEGERELVLARPAEGRPPHREPIPNVVGEGAGGRGVRRGPAAHCRAA